MKRIHRTVVDVRTTDSIEVTRRLHKCITDIAKRLDEQKTHALSIVDIFTSSGEALRVKLKDYCIRLIFKDPVEHARKIEELLWRKGFYDAVHAAKKLRKANMWNEEEEALLSVHLAVGIGFYHHLILRLQLEYGLDMIGAVDFTFTQNVTRTSQGKIQSKANIEKNKECIMRLIHRSLVCLGDLARYKLELDPNWDPMIAKRYYKIAMAIDPNIGMPHNQLGTLMAQKNYGLDAVYHYMRCVLCPEPFEGAEGNLKRAIVTQSICPNDACCAHHCVSRLCSLLQLWDYEISNPDRVNLECQELLNDIENCLLMEHTEEDKIPYIGNEDSTEIYLQNCKDMQANILTDDMVFKIAAICLMSITRLKNKESPEVQGVVAITLAVLSQLVQCAITRLQESILRIGLPPIEENLPLMDNINEPSTEENFIENSRKSKESVTKQNIESEILKQKKKFFDSEKENAENNGNALSDTRKFKEKPKNLLTKLRRRKRKNSTDSDASDAEQTTLISSSEEISSDISETDDGLSQENVLSDDAVSDDVTDDEELCMKVNKDSSTNKKCNGYTSIDNLKMDSTVSIQLINGRNISDNLDSTKMNNQELTTHAGSTVTIVTNVDTNGMFEEINGSPNTVTYITQLKKQDMPLDDILKILVGKDILAAIKICCDWLKSNQDIIRICAKSSRILLKRITILLNLINVDITSIIQKWNKDTMIFTSIEKMNESIKVVPMPEDINLRGLSLLEDAHKYLDWKILHRYKMSNREQVILRVLKLVEFGHYLSSIEDLGIKYDQTKHIFTITDTNPCDGARNNTINHKDVELEHPRGKLMRHMGKLWLRAEVRALESRLRFRVMSPYLVPDHEVLAKYTPALKRLVYAKKFIVVIPTVVVSALDEVKRISGRAREATRWLEAQLRRGSKFLQAQKPHERLAIPLIKRPRPKDREAWLFFQIIECCHYLTQQTKVGLTTDAEAPVVTLLTGYSPDEKKVLTFSPDGLAKSAGVTFEHIEAFHTKWKASSKSHG